MLCLLAGWYVCHFHLHYLYSHDLHLHHHLHHIRWNHSRHHRLHLLLHNINIHIILIIFLIILHHSESQTMIHHQRPHELRERGRLCHKDHEWRTQQRIADHLVTVDQHLHAKPYRRLLRLRHRHR